MIGGPRLDLCDIIDGSTQGSFNTATGDYFFQSTDVFAFEPGTYEFKITGTVGIKSDTATFSLILVDRCLETTFFLKSNPFSNETYYLRDQQIEKIWKVQDLATIVMPYNCGTVTTEFFYEDTSPFDTSIFNDWRISPNSFQVLYTESLDDVGIYEITYRVQFASYPSLSLVQEFPFTVTIVDPCDDPTSVTPSTLVDQEYTIMQA